MSDVFVKLLVETAKRKRKRKCTFRSWAEVAHAEKQRLAALEQRRLLHSSNGAAPAAPLADVFIKLLAETAKRKRNQAFLSWPEVASAEKQRLAALEQRRLLHSFNEAARAATPALALPASPSNPHLRD